MPSEWREFAIGEVATIIGGGTPPTKDEGNFDGSIPWLTPRDLRGYRYRYICRGERSITEKGLTNSNARILPEGAVLLTTRAPVGYVVIASNPLTTNQGFRNLVLRKGFYPEFVYYLLKLNTERLKAYASGSTFGELSGAALKELRFPFPPLPEQHAIAHILGMLDDKIELNRRMNQTLEAMAQALFKSWFVDFEPFRDQGMQDSPLGKIPVGWRVFPVSDLGEVICGKTPPTADKRNYGGDIPFITIPDMRNKVFVTRTTTQLTARGAATQANKLLPENSVCVSCIATPGLVAITSKSSHTNQQINSIICNHDASPYWSYLAMTAKRPEIETGGAGGSATLNLNKSEFSKLQIIKPDSRTMRRFHDLVGPIFSRILSNDLQSITLSSIRDTLLPKLLSGDRRIKDAQKFIGEVA